MKTAMWTAARPPLFLLGMAGLAPATCHYIDAAAGSDANLGTSPEAPWRSLDKVNAVVAAPGDEFRFKKGAVWRGSLKLKSGSAEKPLLYSSYGAGAKPQFRRSVALDREGDWVEEGGGIWVSADPAGLPRDVGNIILDGRAAACKRWSRESLAEENDFWFDLAGDRRIRFRSGSNPALRFDSIEAALMLHVVDHSGASHAVVDGLDIRYGAAHGFGGGNASHLTIRNCDISWIGGGDQYLQGGGGRKVRYGNGIEFWGAAADCLVENNRLWEIYDAAVTNQGHEPNSQERITYRNNLVWNCEYSFEYWNGAGARTSDVVFENNACFDAGRGWGHAQRPDPNGRHFMVYQNRAATTGMVLRGNLFCNATESLVRIDPCETNPDWTRTGLVMDGNRYWNDGGRAYFLWLGKTYNEADFERFRAEQRQEANGVVGRPETGLDQRRNPAPAGAGRPARE